MDKAITRHPIQQFAHLVTMLQFIEVDGKFICHHTHTLRPSKRREKTAAILQIQVTQSALGILLIFKYTVSQINL